MATSRLCSIPDCGKPPWNGRGWCQAHYSRWRRHGDPLAGGPPKTPASTLISFIEQIVLPWNSDECLLWPFTGNNKGYGQVRYKGRRRIASNLICELANGPAPTTKHETAHSCGNGHLGCVNRRHLLWKTRLGNCADRDRHGTTARGERSGTAKLTESQVRQIRLLHGTISQNKIAAMFGITNTMVRYIFHRKAWAWLD